MTQRKAIDLNCDMGEGVGDDMALLDTVTSANIACGAHAGDLETMTATVAAAAARGVAIGAHPSYPDRENFGRKTMASLAPDEIAELVYAQIATLAGVAKHAGVRLTHVKLHGALYNDSARDGALAATVADAVAQFDPRLIVFGLAGSNMINAAKARGLRAAGEGFCDRAYEADGALRSRSLPGAVFEDASAAVRQAMEIAMHQSATAHDGATIPIAAETLCVHGDTPHAPEIARAVRTALEKAGIEVRSLA